MPSFLGVSLDEKDFHKKLRHLKIPPSKWPTYHVHHQAHATTHWFETKDKSAGIVCMGSMKGRTRAQIAALVAHEATHIWQFTVQNMGEAEPSKEFMAYGIQNITQTILEAIWKEKE
jgi:uncharacterized protein YgbK (DUF1537 family)